MKLTLIAFLFIVNFCSAQEWQAEVLLGASGYSGDLSQKIISLKTFRPAVNVNLKYDLDNRVVLRGGLGWGVITADDKDNKQTDLRLRNLNFKTTIVEGSICAELNLFEPGLFYSYPYLFGGLGVFHFNPYTYDKDNKKTYLQPLSTEGEGLPEYPLRKPYKLTQFCLPFGGGWKFNISPQFDIIYELSGRLLFTDYLDDVSTAYVNSQTLRTHKGEKAVELAVRWQPTPGIPFPREGDIRGNPEINDWYFITGIKFLYHFGQGQKQFP